MELYNLFDLVDRNFRDCSVADNQREKEVTFCLTVTIIEKSKNSSTQLETIQDLMIPFLLQTVLKGW